MFCVSNVVITLKECFMALLFPVRLLPQFLQCWPKTKGFWMGLFSVLKGQFLGFLMSSAKRNYFDICGMGTSGGNYNIMVPQRS